MMMWRVGLSLLAGTVAALAQPYTMATIAGGSPLPTPVAAVAAPIGQPQRPAVDGSGNLYFSSSHCVFKVDSSGVLTLVAGTSRPGYSGDGGPALQAQLNSPQGLVLDSSGNLYIADSGNDRVRMVSPGGIITTIAGTGTKGYSGDFGPAISAELRLPSAVRFDSSGNLYIADCANHSIRKVDTSGIITSVAGIGYAGYSGDTLAAVTAQLNGPQDMVLDTAGNIYIADTNNNLVRKIAIADSTISIYAGVTSTSTSGDGSQANTVPLRGPSALALDSTGNLYIVENTNNKVRKVGTDGIISTVAGDGTFNFGGDGGQATKAQMAGPLGMCLYSSGNLYITDPWNYRVRKLASGGTISTVAGNGGSRYLGDGGPALLAQLNQPYGIAVDSAGNVYFSEYGNSRVRKITPDGGITTVAGNGTYGSSGDGGQATKAQLAAPAGLALDTAGNLYIADADSSCVRRVSSSGVIVTVAGNGTYGSSGDGGQATSASLRTPYGVTVDASGNLYIADALANRVRRVTPDGIIATVAGSGALGFTGDGNQATKARLRLPFAVAVDASGTLYIADTGNNRIRQVISNGVITTIAGNGIAGYGGDGGLAKNAQVVGPTALTADANGNLYIGGISANRLRQIAGGSISTIGGAGVLGYSGDGGDALAAQVNGLGGVAVDAAGNIYLADTGNNAVRVMRITPTAKPVQ